MDDFRAYIQLKLKGGGNNSEATTFADKTLFEAPLTWHGRQLRLRMLHQGSPQQDGLRRLEIFEGISEA